MVPFCVIVHYVFGYCCPQVSLTERYEAVETLSTYGENESFRVCVQIRTISGKAEGVRSKYSCGFPMVETCSNPPSRSRERTIDTKLLIYDLFQKGRVLAQDGGPISGAPSTVIGYLPNRFSIPLTLSLLNGRAPSFHGRYPASSLLCAPPTPVLCQNSALLK